MGFVLTSDLVLRELIECWTDLVGQEVFGGVSAFESVYCVHDDLDGGSDGYEQE